MQLSDRYIMMSKQTKESTQQYFQKHDYFGLQPQNVVMFEQSTMPCMTFDGKIILETPSSCAKAPGQTAHVLHLSVDLGNCILFCFCLSETVSSINSLIISIGFLIVHFHTVCYSHEMVFFFVSSLRWQRRPV